MGAARRVLLVLSALLVMLMGVGAPALASASAPARPAVELHGIYYFQNVADGLWLHASKFGAALTDSSGALQRWEIISPHVVGGKTYVQIELIVTGRAWCVDLDNSNSAAYLEQCDQGNVWQFFYIPAAGNGNWFMPYERPNHYMTDRTNGISPHYLYALLPGAGNWAVWGSELLN
jgi:hypothetical protein